MGRWLLKTSGGCVCMGGVVNWVRKQAAVTIYFRQMGYHSSNSLRDPARDISGNRDQSIAEPELL